MSDLRPIKLKQSVSQGLHGYAKSVLPKEIAEHEVVKWLLGFDALAKQSQDSRQSLLAVDRVEGTSYLTLRALALVFKNVLPGYFASLYHIGRMYDIGRAWEADLKVSSSDENMKRSIENLSRTIGNKEKLDQSKAELKAQKVLLSLSGDALARCSDLIRLTNTWLTLWIQEVGELHRSVQEFERAWSSSSLSQSQSGSLPGMAEAMQLAMVCQRRSQLFDLMADEGVQVKRPESDAIYKEGTMPLLMALISDALKTHDVYHVLSDWAHWDRKLILTQSRNLLVTDVQVALDLLSRKYRDNNPFERYLPLQYPASIELRDLMKEHLLPTGEPSPWRASWEQRLELVGRPAPLIRHSGHFSNDDLQWVLKLTDSAIKARIDGPLRPMEDWHAFVQRLFYANVVDIMHWSFYSPTVHSRVLSTRLFSMSRAYGLMKVIVDGMNERGYQFDKPTREQFEDVLMNIGGGSTSENLP